jgi:flagellar M-ring protein FliF
VLLGTNQFSQVEVTCSLDMDYSNYEETVKRYTVEDGRDEGYLSHSETYEAENEDGSSYVPGTDSNDETVYVSPDSSSSSSTQTETLKDYLPNEDIQYKITPAGAINYSNSSMSIALIRYREYKEEDVKSQGLLDGITWAEFKANNAEDVKLEVDEDYYSMAANATGIPVEKITILSYESPVFVDKAGMTSEDATVIASVFMLVVILALLAFVVLRSMRGHKQASEEEELSVENLLQSTQETELEDIDVESKSETRKMIEKFVDENPEAAASLLRNWLSEDW